MPLEVIKYQGGFRAKQLCSFPADLNVSGMPPLRPRGRSQHRPAMGARCHCPAAARGHARGRASCRLRPEGTVSVAELATAARSWRGEGGFIRKGRDSLRHWLCSVCPVAGFRVMAVQLFSTFDEVSFSSLCRDPVSMDEAEFSGGRAKACAVCRCLSGLENTIWDINDQKPTKCQNMAPVTKPRAAARAAGGIALRL